MTVDPFEYSKAVGEPVLVWVLKIQYRIGEGDLPHYYFSSEDAAVKAVKQMGFVRHGIVGFRLDKEPTIEAYIDGMPMVDTIKDPDALIKHLKQSLVEWK